jgi:hypothetical protein
VRALAAVLVALACGRPHERIAESKPSPPAAIDAAVDLASCRERCRGVVRSRHDACGRYAPSPRPEWCADDNRRMQDDCEASCRGR